jgi:flagellar basal body-associated protein FliL
MIKHKIQTNRKGINPLITIILLVILLISVGGIILTWMSLEERAGHAVQIQSVRFEESTTTIYVQNTGKGTVILDSLYIDNDKFGLSEENCIVGSEETTTVKETQTAEITITRGYQKEIHIKVICKDGTYHEADWEPRQR